MRGSKTKIRERTRGKKDRRGRVWMGGKERTEKRRREEESSLVINKQ